MIKTACPSCGGEIIFKTRTSILCVCSYCRSNVVRHGVDYSLAGKQSELQEDMSPIQIGSIGKYRNQSFQVLGRQVLAWSDGRWSEWYIGFSNGSGAWIAEAQGEFFINFLYPNSLELDLTQKSLTVKGISYHKVDNKDVECVGSEGELPFKVIEGTKSNVTDYTDSEGGFASVEKSDEGVLVHTGEVTNLRQLKMKGLKSFEGWGRF